jgi:hypothetical protein
VTKIFQHIFAARPSAKLSFSFALVWAFTMAASVFLGSVILRNAVMPGFLRIAFITGCGALIAAPFALWLAEIRAPKDHITAFATLFVALSLLTLAATAFLFAFDFWWFFSEWHGVRFTKLWLIQLGFTFASAIYQFLVSGLRLYIPFGVIALVLASFWWAKQTIIMPK